MPDPLPLPESASLALCPDRATAEQVQALCDSEAGLPRYATRTLAGNPIPAGAPCATLHAHDPEPLKDGQWSHPLPCKPLPVALAAKVLVRTPAEIEDLKPVPVAEPITEVAKRI